MNYEDFEKLLEHIEEISKQSNYLCRHSSTEVCVKAAKINNLAHEVSKFLNRRKPKK